jgi:hypothetical protein
MTRATDTAYLTPPQVAARLRVNVHKVLTWINSGRLRALNISTGHERPRYRIAECDLLVFLDSLAVNPAPAQTRRRRQKDMDVIEFIS